MSSKQAEYVEMAAARVAGYVEASMQRGHGCPLCELMLPPQNLHRADCPYPALKEALEGENDG